MSNFKEYNVEELTYIASQKGNTIKNLVNDKSNVVDFIREYGVTDGSDLVPNYKIYHDYCKNWKPMGRKISKIGFFRKFNKAFRSRRDKNTRYYLLNKEAFSLTEDDLNEAKGFDKNYRRNIKNKQKRKNKTSGSAKEV